MASLGKRRCAEVLRRFQSDGAAATLPLLQGWADKGFDVAGQPFVLLDVALSFGGDAQGIDALAGLCPGGQPQLLHAICSGLRLHDTAALDAIIADPRAHPQTRFEAMGWQIFLRNHADWPAGAASLGPVMQYWDSTAPPPEITKAMAIWQDQGTAYKSFDKDHARRFIARTQGEDVARIFDSLWHPALQSDVFRLCFLQNRGGFYADADALPGGGTPGFLSGAGDGALWAASMTNRPNCVVTNSPLAAQAGNPVLAAFLQDVLGRLKDAQIRNIFWLSGPGALTYFLWRTKAQIRVLPAALTKARLFRQFDAPYKQTELNWRVHEHRAGLSDDDILPTLMNANPG